MPFVTAYKDWDKHIFQSLPISSFIVLKQILASVYSVSRHFGYLGI